jgi:lysophospholipase L1-like esterase
MRNVTLSGNAVLYTVPMSDPVHPQDTPLTNKRGLFIGDSQMAGANGSFDGDNIATFFAEKTGCYAYNHGVNGANPKSYWDTRIKDIDFSRRFDFAIICLGTNGGLTDTLDTDVTAHTHYMDYADTYTGCYCKIIEYIKERNPDTQIFLCIPVDSTRDIIDSCRVVIPKIAERYHLPVIDIYNESGINDGNRWMYSNDGLHFTIPGYRLIGNYIANRVLANGCL